MEHIGTNKVKISDYVYRQRFINFNFRLSSSLMILVFIFKPLFYLTSKALKYKNQYVKENALLTAVHDDTPVSYNSIQ
jgi:hypothetical protein